MNNTKKTVLTGITPSGKLTLGNYIGAIKSLLEFQSEYHAYIFIADLHAITNNTQVIDTKLLKDNSFEIACWYLACGLKPENNTIFLQSDVSEHTELAYILMCHTNLGELERMTQYKDKSSKNPNQTVSIPSGLLYYPILMAADILLYKPNIVPTGIDQKQHLELTKTLADKLRKYDLELPVFEKYISKNGAKIMNLLAPAQKMSKSNKNPKTYILLSDTAEQVEVKIKSAVTDSESKIYYDEHKKPGISNLLNIYAVLANISIKELEIKYADITSYAVFKKDLIIVINEALAPIQSSFQYYYRNPKIVKSILKKAANRAKEIARANLDEIKEKLFFDTKNY